MRSNDGGAFYRRLGVRRVINAASWLTVLGGSLMPEPVLSAMRDASHWFVDMHELNRKAGDVVATFTGAEAGLVTAGSAAGMLLEAAACITGTDPAKINRLPDTAGMRNEIVIHRAHRLNYDHNFRAAGARLVEIGDSRTTNEWELDDAIGENTAAVAFIFAQSQDTALPLPTVLEIAHRRGVPVIVDAAAMLPPVENLTRYVDMGADMVSFSGGKGVLGPQSTGILCGRGHLIEAAYMNSAPNSTGIGRSAKVCKEEIAGLVTALELFVDTDHQAVAAGWSAKCAHIIAALDDIPGLKVELEEMSPTPIEASRVHPQVLISFETSWRGPDAQAVAHQLEDDDPSIRVRPTAFTDSIAVIPVNLQDGEEEIVARRLREVLAARG